MLNFRQVFLVDKIEFVRNKYQILKYRFQILKQIVQNELIIQNNVNQFIYNNNKKQNFLLRNEIIVISNNMQNNFVELLIEFNKINIVKSISFLININKRN